MGDTKLARQIYTLAMEIEDSHNSEAGSAGYEAARRREARVAAQQKNAEKMVQFQDPAGNTFMLPYSIVGNAMWMYSPYDKSRAERTGYVNLTLTGKAEEVFLSSETPEKAEEEVEEEAKTAARNKTADKMVRFQDAAGGSFVLPHEDVGYARWAYSPWDRSRAERQDIINVQITGRLEEALGLEG